MTCRLFLQVSIVMSVQYDMHSSDPHFLKKKKLDNYIATGCIRTVHSQSVLLLTRTSLSFFDRTCSYCLIWHHDCLWCVDYMKISNHQMMPLESKVKATYT